MRSLFKSITVAILSWEARMVVRKYRPKIIAITGSVGKTSTKDAIFEALAPGRKVRKSQKSFNSELGVPLTILGLPNGWNNPVRWIANFLEGLFLVLIEAPYPEWLVLEIGADRPGDIRSIARWLPVDIAVITRLPEVPVHVEFFDSPEQVIEEKASLLGAIRQGGALALYGDDDLTRSLERRVPELADGVRIITFGFRDWCDVRGLEPAALRESPESWPMGMVAEIMSGGEKRQLEVRGALGSHAFLPALGAVAAASAAGVPLSEAIEGLGHYDPPAGRMHLLPGIKDTLIIDDTYNASPAAVSAALEALALAKKPGGRAIAAIGDMLELGRVSVVEHKKIGAQAAKCCDVLITVGFRSHDIAQGALDAGMAEANILQFEDSQKAGEELQNLLRAADVVLIKGSQSIRMERAVEEVMAHPERASELLVRQDREWKKR